MSVPSIVSLRLDVETRRAVARLARARRQSQSRVIREAVAALIERTPSQDRPYDAWAPVIGIAKGGPPDLSERTGERFRQLLSERKRRRS